MAGLLIACDFDGTITERDTLHVIIDAFGAPGLWDALEPRMQAGQITVQEAMQLEFSAVRASPSQVADLVAREAPVRAGAYDFAAAVAAAGHELVVMSAGFRSVIDPVLAAVGLSHLEVVSNEAHFSPDGCQIDWTLPGDDCERCGRTCKRHAISLRQRGREVVYIGDGISDRCPSLDADRVFARAGLAEYLDTQGVAYTPFDDFHQIAEHLDVVSPA